MMVSVCSYIYVVMTILVKDGVPRYTVRWTHEYSVLCHAEVRAVVGLAALNGITSYTAIAQYICPQ